MQRSDMGVDAHPFCPSHPAPMNKKDLSERDICSKFISPAVKRAGWDWMMQIREEVAFTNASRPMSSVSRKFVSQ